jgi:AcrR family transcriptional regulator
VNKSGFERRTQQKREAILDAAQTLFFERGIGNVAVTEIARQAHVSPVTIFSYFGTKQALAREVMKRYMDRAMAEAEYVLTLDAPFQEKLTRLFVAQARHSNQVGERFAQSLAWDDPEMQALYRRYAEERSIPFFRALVEQGKVAGAIRQDMSFEAIVAYILTFQEILSRPDFLKSDSAYKADLAHLFYFGLLGKESL